jgi:hypothetical protein
MRSNRSGQIVADQVILDRAEDMILLSAIAAGRVTRGLNEISSAITAPHVLDGWDPIRLRLNRLARQELISMPISGPPLLLQRGRRLLAIANGELPAPMPE